MHRGTLRHSRGSVEVLYVQENTRTAAVIIVLASHISPSPIISCQWSQGHGTERQKKRKTIRMPMDRKSRYPEKRCSTYTPPGKKISHTAAKNILYKNGSVGEWNVDHRGPKKTDVGCLHRSAYQLSQDRARRGKARQGKAI